MNTLAIKKLQESAPHMKFIAKVMYAVGILTTLTIVGILWSWIYFWFASVLWTGSRALEKGFAEEDEESIALGCTKIYDFFKLTAIFTAIGLGIFFLYVAAIIIQLAGWLGTP